jgi:hypothetical protein
MKRKVLPVKSPVVIVIASTAFLCATTPVVSQDALMEKAKQSCVDAAKAKGFDLKEVLSSESTANGGVKIILNLTRKGGSAKLTCNQTKEGKVTLGGAGTSSTAGSNADQSTGSTSGDTTGTSTGTGEMGTTSTLDSAAASANVKTYSGWLNPWLGLLLPLLGLLPLLLFAKGWHESGYPTRWGKKASTVTLGRNSEAVVRHSHHDGTDVHSGPGSNYQVTRHLQNGNRVILTGRQDNHWVELTDGGWLPIETLDLDPHLV